MSLSLHPRPDLGLRSLIPEWARLLRREHLGADLVSAASLALLAIPLSLAIGLASGVPPEMAITTAIVAGVLASLFGGSRLAVNGPAAAMAVLVASIVADHGIVGILLVTMACGGLQIVTGALGFGRVMRLVPVSVIEGFTAGIGAIILVQELPRLLGLGAPESSHILDVFSHLGQNLGAIQPVAVAIALTTVALAIGIGRFAPRLPGILIAVAVPSVAVALLGSEVQVIGAIPSTLQLPSWPSELPAFSELLMPILMVYALGSLESLLSAAAVDKLARTTRHDPDQELIGSGVANVAAGFLGGIPATGVIARSALNVQAGGRTRRAAFLHAVIVALMVFLAARWISQIPIAALSGVLVSVALRMLNVRKLMGLWRVSRGDALVYLVTFSVMVSVDLIQGVQWGIAAALIVTAIWTTRSHVRLHSSPQSGVHRLTLHGPLTFLASLRIDTLRAEAALVGRGERAVLDLRDVSVLDATGAEMFLDVVESMIGRGVTPFVVGLRPEVEEMLTRADHGGLLEGRISPDERHLRRVLRGDDVDSAVSAGLDAYRLLDRPRYTDLFGELANGQAPDTLLISCADSRIVTSLITSSDPGEVFTVRNVGNMVPRYSESEVLSTAAALEYAIGVLQVRDVVICGHSGCGAIQSLRKPDAVPEGYRALRTWLGHVVDETAAERAPHGASNDDVSRLNVRQQLDNLRTYPVVAERLAEGDLRLHGWFFDVGCGDVEIWNEAEGVWLGRSPEVQAGAA